jgi:hypothetical protein
MNGRIHERNLSNRLPGSGDSLVNNTLFRDWLRPREGQAQSPKLWLRAPPGTGKSYLCSSAIEHVASELQCVALYQFCRFDDRFSVGPGGDDPSGVVRATALLVHQLFQHFWRRDRRITTPISEFARTADKTMSSLIEMARLILKHGLQQARAEDGASNRDGEPTRLFLFLDGIDILDEKGSNPLLEVVKLLDGVEELGVSPRIWISSQETFPLARALALWPSIEGSHLTLDDVNKFLRNSIPDLSSQFDDKQEIDEKPSKPPDPMFTSSLTPTALDTNPYIDVRYSDSYLTVPSRRMGVGQTPSTSQRELSIRQTNARLAKR